MAWRPYDRGASLKWLAFRLAWHVGIAGGLPGIERASLIGIPERDAVLGPLAPPAIYVGTPDRRQKAVLFHGDPSGRRLAVEKVAIGADAADAIAQETRILRQLATLCPSLGPEVLRSDGDRLVTRWVDGSLIGPRLDETLLELLASLRRDNEIETTAEQRAAFSLPPRLPAFIEHGDLAPWNIRRAGGRLHLTDWEDGRIDGMPLQDLVGWILAVRHLLAGQPPSEALRSERPVLDAFARRIGIEVATVPGLVMLYLTQTPSSGSRTWRRRLRGGLAHSHRDATGMSLRILLSAYACRPDRGSEPAVGWNWAVTMGQLGHRVTVADAGSKPPLHRGGARAGARRRRLSLSRAASAHRRAEASRADAALSSALADERPSRGWPDRSKLSPSTSSST